MQNIFLIKKTIVEYRHSNSCESMFDWLYDIEFEMKLRHTKDSYFLFPHCGVKGKFTV